FTAVSERSALKVSVQRFDLIATQFYEIPHLVAVHVAQGERAVQLCDHSAPILQLLENKIQFEHLPLGVELMSLPNNDSMTGVRMHELRVLLQGRTKRTQASGNEFEVWIEDIEDE